MSETKMWQVRLGLVAYTSEPAPELSLYQRVGPKRGDEVYVGDEVVVEDKLNALESQLAAAREALGKAENMREIANGAAESWQATAIATEQREEEQKVRRRTAEAERDAALAANAVLVAMADELIAYVQPCDIDAYRDYCVVHHEKHCPADALVLKARANLYTTSQEETK